MKALTRRSTQQVACHVLSHSDLWGRDAHVSAPVRRHQMLRCMLQAWGAWLTLASAAVCTSGVRHHVWMLPICAEFPAVAILRVPLSLMAVT